MPNQTPAGFYHVQIPYRGIIPVIMKRGPLPDVLLNREQIDSLLACKVELLNPDTGKPFHYPNPAGGINEKKGERVPKPVETDPLGNPAPQPIITPEQDDTEDPVEPFTAETGPEPPVVVQNPQSLEDVADAAVKAAGEAIKATVKVDGEEVPGAVDTRPDDSDPGEPAEEEDEEDALSSGDAQTDPNSAEYDYTKIEGYSKLSKSQKRELRAEYAEFLKAKAGNVTAEELSAFYAAQNAKLRGKQPTL